MLIKYFHHFLILLFAVKTKTNAAENCFLNETVDLHNSILLPNGSYLYENTLLIPSELIREHSSTILASNSSDEKIQTQKLGCICGVKQCLRFCSHEVKNFYEKHKNVNYDVTVYSSDGSITDKHLINDFYPIYGNVCEIEKSYMLSPETETEEYYWTLYENTTLVRDFDNKHMSLDEYCFDIRINGAEFYLNPVVCTTSPVVPWYEACAKAFSVPFLIAAIIFYNSLTERNERNKCFQAYLFFVTLSCTMFSLYTISRIILDSISCQIFAFTFYYSNMSYLMWTCILSYDISQIMMSMIDNRPSFRTYCVMAVIVPLLMTVATFLAHRLQLPEKWQPGISINLCAVDTLRWSTLIYDFIPRTVAFIYSLRLYIKIVHSKLKHEKGLMKLFPQKREPLLEKFLFFFRIFLLMGISWYFDILTNIIRVVLGKEENPISLTIELLNSLYGFFVFLTLMIRPAYLRQVKERFSRRCSCAETAL